MKYPCIPLSWKLEETLQLLQLIENESDWSCRVIKLSQIFGDERPPKFFTETSCKDEFERVMSSGHPEHFLRQQGERYSQKELIHAWIVYLQKQYEIKKAREGELLLIKLREKANLFNRLFADDCDLTDDEITRLLEQAREEDSKRDPEVVNRELAVGMQKLKELQTLHETNPEKYPALKIIIPPSNPLELSNMAPFSPIKPLFEGLNPPPQPVTVQTKLTSDAGQGAASLLPVKVNSSAQKESSIPLKVSVLETAGEASDDTEKPPCTRTRLRTISTDSRAAGSAVSSFSSHRPATVGGFENLSAAGEQIFKSPNRSNVDEVESTTSRTDETVKNEIEEVEGHSTAMDDAAEKKETSRTRRGQKIVMRRSSVESTNNVDNETASSAQHEHTLRSRRSSAASALVSGTKIPAGDVEKQERNVEEEEDAGKLRRSERHHVKTDTEASTSTAAPQAGRLRKRAAKIEIGNNEDERKPASAKRRRLSSRALESVSRSENKHQVQVNIEEQSSPEPEKVKNEAEHESDDEKALVDLRSRPRSTRAAVAAEEKAKEKAGTAPETSSTRSARKIAVATRSNRRQSRKGGSVDGDVEQKAVMVTAWRLVSSHRHAAIFAHPVSDRDARGYSKIVKSRMDLSTLKKQLDGGHLLGMKNFKLNVLLMFANAVMFNSTGHDVNHYAKEMASDTLSSLKMLQKEVLFVRGTTHMTRRSAAFAAEEAKFERSRFSSPRATPASSEEPSKEKVSENASRETSEISKSSRAGKAAKD